MKFIYLFDDGRRVNWNNSMTGVPITNGYHILDLHGSFHHLIKLCCQVIEDVEKGKSVLRNDADDMR